MSTGRTLYHLIQADFRERSRSYSFLIVLGLMLAMAYAAVPAPGAGYRTFVMGQYRAIYNSAWIGTVMAMITIIFLNIAAFYIVNGSIQRDLQTGVGQIIATSPINKMLYLFGKWLSNCAVLALMVVILAIGAGVMQLIKGEENQILLSPLISPLLFFTVPNMALVAALAVLFETVPGLRAGFGNIVYFFLMVFVFTESRLGLTPIPFK